MARPQKKGLDYFPLDVSMDTNNDNIEMLESKYGILGFASLVKLYMKIYQSEGYFIKWDEKVSLILSKRVSIDIETLNNIIIDLVNWGVFDKSKFEKYNILTSKRIQETYIDATKKRKNVDIDESILLVKVVNSNINLVNSDINSINSDINPQSKEEKSKVKESKEEESKEPEPSSNILTYNGFVKLGHPEIGKNHYDLLLELKNENVRIPFGDSFRPIFYEWLAYRREIKKPYKKIGLKKLLKSIGEFNEQFMTEKINVSITNTHQGLIFPEDKAKFEKWKREKGESGPIVIDYSKYSEQRQKEFEEEQRNAG